MNCSIVVSRVVSSKCVLTNTILAARGQHGAEEGEEEKERRRRKEGMKMINDVMERVDKIDGGFLRITEAQVIGVRA